MIYKVHFLSHDLKNVMSIVTSRCPLITLVILLIKIIMYAQVVSVNMRAILTVQCEHL